MNLDLGYAAKCTNEDHEPEHNHSNRRAKMMLRAATAPPEWQASR